jgi:hypothetical protein
LPDDEVYAAAFDYALGLVAKPSGALQTSPRLLQEGIKLSAQETIEKEVAQLNVFIPAIAKVSAAKS